MTPPLLPGTILPFRASELIARLRAIALESHVTIGDEQIRKAILAQAQYYVSLNAEWADNAQGQLDQTMQELQIPKLLRRALNDDAFISWVDTFLDGADPWLTYRFRWIGRMLTVEIGDDARVTEWEQLQLADEEPLTQRVEFNPEPEDILELVGTQYRDQLARRVVTLLRQQFGVNAELRNGRIYQNQLQFDDLCSIIRQLCSYREPMLPSHVQRVSQDLKISRDYPTAPEGRYIIVREAKDDVPLRIESHGP